MTVYVLPRHPGWADNAACRGKPVDVFFPEYPDNGPRPATKAVYAAARVLCAVCPVTTDCLNYAIVNNIEHGMWGGSTPRQRRRLRVAPNAQIRYPCRTCGDWIQHSLSSTRGFRHECFECRRLRNLEYHKAYDRRRRLA